MQTSELDLNNRRSYFRELWPNVVAYKFGDLLDRRPDHLPLVGPYRGGQCKRRNRNLCSELSQLYTDWIPVRLRWMPQTREGKKTQSPNNSNLRCSSTEKKLTLEGICAASRFALTHELRWTDVICMTDFLRAASICTARSHRDFRVSCPSRRLSNVTIVWAS
jgi:hypothetical protein